MSTDTATPAAEAPVSRDDLASMFLADIESEGANDTQPNAASAEVETQSVEPAEAVEAPDQDSPEGDDVAADDSEPEVEPDEANPPPALEYPSGMSEADKANFAKLTPELQTWLSQTKRSADAQFTKKSQEVAAVQKQFGDRIEALAGAMQRYDSILSQFTDTQISPPDPALKDQDPFSYEQQMDHYVQAKHRQEVAARERQENAKAYQELQKRQRIEWLEAQGEQLKEIAPELADRSPKGQQLFRSVLEYANKAGYAAEQINNAGALDLSVLLKAMRYDAAQKAKSNMRPAPVAAPKATKPGPSKMAGGRPSNLARAVEQVRTTGTREALAAAYLADIQSERR